jgi:preprotein translocase subunit Sec61beta
MAEREKTYMPQSTAGLIRYFEGEEGIKITPKMVVAISAGFGALILLLRFLAI